MGGVSFYPAHSRRRRHHQRGNAPEQIGNIALRSASEQKGRVEE